MTDSTATLERRIARLNGLVEAGATINSSLDRRAAAGRHDGGGGEVRGVREGIQNPESRIQNEVFTVKLSESVPAGPASCCSPV